MTTWNGTVHPAADLFPMIEGDELDQLVESIRTGGLTNPGHLLPDGTLLDGRNRRVACERAGVPMRWNVYNGDDPIGFVVQSNIHRRHLEIGQRAMLALELLPLYEAEARKKQLAAAARGGERPASKGGANPPQPSADRAPRSRDVAAESVGSSGRNVQRAKYVAKTAPDLAEKVKTGDLALNAAEKQARRRVSQAQEQDAREATLSAAVVDAEGTGWRLLHGDFRERLLELPAGCVDLIVTDPPYPAESLPLYADLARIARHVLSEDGICVVLTGQIYLDRVLAMLSEHLNYGWTYVQPLPGANSRIMGRHVHQTWKPWVAFSKNAWPSGRIEFHPDTLDPSYRAKDQYRWQQDATPARLLIDSLCPPGGTVCDPFTGTGSYGKATLSMDRRFIGVELDGDRFETAKGTLDAASDS
jgi:hypothetical protein